MSPEEARLMAVAYQMPIRTEQAAKVGPRLFRKTILRAGKISKNGYEVDIDRPYLETLVRNFTAGLKDTVTLQLADRLNRHNEDPERTRGRLQGLELTANDELVGIFEVSEDGAALLEKYPYIGCSVAIDPQFERADGRKAGPTLLHVAATTDPEVSKLGDWVALSSDYERVIDLTATEASTQESASSAEHGGDATPLEDPVASLTAEQIAKLLTDEQLVKLRELIEGDGNSVADSEDSQKAATAEAEDTEPEFTDAELDAMAQTADEVEQASEEEPQLVAASSEREERDEVLELTARLDAQAAELNRLRRERDDERYSREKDELVRNFGIPADVVELARPLLHGTDHRVELSSGKQVDAGQVMRKVLHELGRRYAKALDLGAEYGTADAEDDQARRQRELDEFVARVTNAERR